GEPDQRILQPDGGGGARLVRDAPEVSRSVRRRAAGAGACAAFPAPADAGEDPRRTAAEGGGRPLPLSERGAAGMLYADGWRGARGGAGGVRRPPGAAGGDDRAGGVDAVAAGLHRPGDVVGGARSAGTEAGVPDR